MIKTHLCAITVILMCFSSAKAWLNPQNIVTWGDLDGAVAEKFAGFTNAVSIYPPGAFVFGISAGYYTFAPDGDLAAATNLFAFRPRMGIPVWTISITETQTSLFIRLMDLIVIQT